MTKKGSKKIEINALCPCGSGKKYKKCCLQEDMCIVAEEFFQNRCNVGRLTIMKIDRDLKKKSIEEMEKWASESNLPFDREEFMDYRKNSWDIDRVKKMKTDEIITKLKSFNITFSIETFKEQSQKHISAIKLADEFYYPEDLNIDGWDKDFIMLAIIELWNRLIPERVNLEMLDEEMQIGYEELETGNYRKAVDRWITAWDIIKIIVPNRIDSIDGADNFFPEQLNQLVSNWCQNFEMQLHNAGIDDESYLRKLIEYCDDFLGMFPNSDELIIFNMLRAKADSYAHLGHIRTAERYYKDIVKQYPEEEMSYAGWGDIYDHHTNDDNREMFCKRAEEIYRLGIKKCKTDNEALLQRLEDLEEERKGVALH